MFGASVAELEAMPNDEKVVWRHCAVAQLARERLAFFSDMNLLLLPHDSPHKKAALIDLIKTAFPDPSDEDQRSDWLEAITRKG